MNIHLPIELVYTLEFIALLLLILFAILGVYAFWKFRKGIWHP